jgi:hypothetical protein
MCLLYVLITFVPAVLGVAEAQSQPETTCRINTTDVNILVYDELKTPANFGGGIEVFTGTLVGLTQVAATSALNEAYDVWETGFKHLWEAEKMSDYVSANFGTEETAYVGVQFQNHDVMPGWSVNAPFANTDANNTINVCSDVESFSLPDITDLYGTAVLRWEAEDASVTAVKDVICKLSLRTVLMHELGHALGIPMSVG